MVSQERVISIVGLAAALISGVLAWFVRGSSGYSIVDAYNFVIKLASGGATLSSPAFSSGFGTLLNTSASNFTVLLVALAITLIFWPAGVISSLIELLGGSAMPLSPVYGIIALASGYFFTSSFTGMTIGAGFIIGIVAVIILFTAFFVENARKSKQRATLQLPEQSVAYTCIRCGAKVDLQTAISGQVTAAHIVTSPSAPA